MITLAAGIFSSFLQFPHYPKEGNPRWEKYSAQAIIHTIGQYNKYSLDYLYASRLKNEVASAGKAAGAAWPHACGPKMLRYRR